MPPLPQPAHQAIADHHEHNALLELIARLEQHITPPGPGHADWYDWISLPLTTYLHGMRSIRVSTSGPVATATSKSAAGSAPSSSSRTPSATTPPASNTTNPTSRVSRAIAPHCPVIHGDALHQDGAYRNADIIYNYSIATNQDQHHQINQLITYRMRRGTIYFTAQTPPARPAPAHRRERLDQAMTPPAKKASPRGNIPKTTTYTVAGHPIGPLGTTPEHVRDLLHTVGVGDEIDLTLSQVDASALRDQGILA